MCVLMCMIFCLKYSHLKAASRRVGLFAECTWGPPTPWQTNIAIEMAIEIVDLPIKNGDFPLLC